MKIVYSIFHIMKHAVYRARAEMSRHRMLLLCTSTLVLVVLCTGVFTQDDNPPKGKGIGKEPGPWVWPTRGEVWPKPQNIVNYNNQGYMIIRPSQFQFKVTRETCDILEAALNRYYSVLITERDANLRALHPTSDNEIPGKNKKWLADATFRGYLDSLSVELMAPCETMPYFGMDEHYELRVDSPDVPLAAKLTSQTIWGILHGLETFVQLVAPSVDGTALHINSSAISDFPRFSHRGLMIDSVRHFHPLSTIFKLIDGMEANKLNVLHWHIVDDQAFPYQSKVFPELSEKGAYHPFTHVHSQPDIRAVIEYCRLRGIRVLAEFDTPGHTRSWGESHPEILTTCIGSNGQPDGSYGPLDPSKEETYTFVQTLFQEVHDVFPDRYFHLGGDEVDFDCWKSNPNITAFMAANGIAGQYAKLEELYISRVINMTESKGDVAVLWQEVFDNGLQLSSDSIVHVWKPGHELELAQVTAANHLALLSSCWYLDHLKTGGDWKEYYACEPHAFTGTDQQKQLVLGGEACMWSEYVDTGNVLQRVYPRASAMAERLWSAKTQTDTVEAARRLEEFRCRLVRRGIPAQPANGPGFCPGETFD